MDKRFDKNNGIFDNGTSSNGPDPLAKELQLHIGQRETKNY